MKKYLLLIAAAALIFVGCGKKQAAEKNWAGVDVKEAYEQLNAEAEAAFYAAETEEEQNAIVAQFLDDVYHLLEANMGAPYSDSLFLSVYAFLPEEQQDVLFDNMPESMKTNEKIAEAYKAYQVKKTASAGKPYLDFTAVTPEGKELALSALVGKTDYVLVDFWASWCGTCRRLIPVLKEIYARQPQGHLQIFSCSVDQDEAAWRKALAEENMPWVQAREDEEHECSDLYGVQYIPYTILIDKAGNIVGVNLEEPELEEILMK